MMFTHAGLETVEWQGAAYTTVLTTRETGGAMSITDSVSPPKSGPPRHIHHDADEAFFIVSGDVEFYVEGDRFTRGPGQTAFIPRNTEHTFRVVSDIASRHLIVLTPGGFERFFKEMAAGQFQIPQDMPAIEQCAKRHNLSFTGPPLDDPKGATS